MNAQPDRLFIARLEDMLGQCGRYSAPVFSSFLDERQCAETEIWLRANAGDCGYLLWGGYPDARRKMLAVFPEYLRGGITELFPMKCLTFAYRKEDTLTHLLNRQCYYSDSERRTSKSWEGSGRHYPGRGRKSHGRD